MYYYFPRVGWYPLSDQIAYDIGKETGLDHRRGLHGWGIRWLNYDVMFCVKETDDDDGIQNDIHAAADWLRARGMPCPEPEVRKKPTRKRKPAAKRKPSAG